MLRTQLTSLSQAGQRNGTPVLPARRICSSVRRWPTERPADRTLRSLLATGSLPDGSAFKDSTAQRQKRRASLTGWPFYCFAEESQGSHATDSKGCSAASRRRGFTVATCDTTFDNLAGWLNQDFNDEALRWGQHALVTSMYFGGILTSAASPLVSVSWLCVLRRFPEDMLVDGCYSP